LNRRLISLSGMVACALWVVALNSADAGTKPDQVVGSAPWCQAAVTAPAACGPVKGVVGGAPFVCESVLWNSFSVTFKQSHKRYCKVVVNMMQSEKPLCNKNFTSDNNKHVQVYVYTRESSKAKVVEKHLTSKDNFGLKFKLGALRENDSVPGALTLRLPDGSYINGAFLAQKAPRVIWDDQAVLP